MEFNNTNPLEIFKEYYEKALAGTNPWSHNMVLSTCGKDMQPQSRNVSLYKWDEQGFVFCSNYEGPKARELEENPKAAILFQWSEILKQVRITGIVTKLERQETEQLFKSVGRPHQCIFYASSLGKEHPYNQSSVVDSREKRVAHLESIRNEFKAKEIPLPPGTNPQSLLAWGGYVLSPSMIEFADLSVVYADRTRFTKQDNGNWVKEYLMP